MENSASPNHSPNPPASGAFKFLSNLPSRGLLSSTVVSSNLGGMRVYVCDYDTEPPEGQHIQTNQTNILIRSLQIKAENAKDTNNVSSTDGSKKRISTNVIDGHKASAKRSNTQQVPKQEVSESSSSRSKNFHSLTVEKLRALLKERGLSTKGKKDELVARLRSVND